MTIREFVLKDQGKDFISSRCTRCFRKQKPVFRIRIDNPTDDQVKMVRMKANRHDRTGKHDVITYLGTK